MEAGTQALLVTSIIAYVTLFAVYELMVLSVNRQLPSEDAVSLIPLRQWRRLLFEHRHFFPRSVLPVLAVEALVLCLITSALLAGYRLWLFWRN